MTRPVVLGASALAVAAALLLAARARPRVVASHAASRGQVGAAAADSFLALARAGTARFADPAAAGRAGFRRVGVEFPAMGEHWVNLARVMADTLDASSPPVLTYARIHGRLALVGVGYTDIMAGGERVPAFATAHWHEHNGSIAEESLARPAVGGAFGGAAPRVAILHAWAWVPNPAGPFVTDNAALPFVRHGLRPTAGADPRLVAALALAAGEADYYELMSRPDDGGSIDDSVARAVLARHAAAALALVRGAGDSLDVGTRTALLARWRLLWQDVAHAIPERAGAARRLREHGDVHGHH
jgi:hypothetical protein